jgi:hypothetical protein
LADLHTLDERVDKQFFLAIVQAWEIAHKIHQFVSNWLYFVGLFMHVVDLVLQSPLLFLPDLIVREIFYLGVDQADGLGGQLGTGLHRYLVVGHPGKLVCIGIEFLPSKI